MAIGEIETLGSALHHQLVHPPQTTFDPTGGERLLYGRLIERACSRYRPRADVRRTEFRAGNQSFDQAIEGSLTTIAKAVRMMPMSTICTMNIALPEPMRAYVTKRVESGQYGNTSEYVRELIRKDQREQAITSLRALVEEGLASGPATSDTRSDWDDLRSIARGSASGE